MSRSELSSQSGRPREHDGPAPYEARLRSLISELVTRIGNRPLDGELDAWLNADCGPGSPTCDAIKAACTLGVAEGWMCAREGSGIRYGRVIKPADDVRRYSVDVVDMADVVGPHHVHPEGEIDLIAPIEGDARFNGRPAGSLVCPPGSAHCPTVTGGRALVLYLLPEGRIEFTRQAG